MIVAFPIESENGLKSKIDEHFGVAPFFLIVDSDSKKIEVLQNKKFSDKHASCKSDRFAGDMNIEAVITKCIGNGSLRNLNKQNIKVFQAQSNLVEENLKLLVNGKLNLFHMFDICQGKKNKKEHKDCGHH